MRISSFLEFPSTWVTLYSNHCWTIAFSSAVLPSKYSLLASLTRWAAIVANPVRHGPLFVWRTGIWDFGGDSGVGDIGRKKGWNCRQESWAQSPHIAVAIFPERHKPFPASATFTYTVFLFLFVIALSSFFLYSLFFPLFPSFVISPLSFILALFSFLNSPLFWSCFCCCGDLLYVLFIF